MPNRRPAPTHSPALSQFIDVAHPQGMAHFTRNLGVGEQGVLQLALERSADLVLMDDRKARNEAARHGLTCAFTTDVLRLAEQREIISSCTAVIDALREHRIYLPGVAPAASATH
jgi:hypothetical protein